jgi:hypothetical protein
MRITYVEPGEGLHHHMIDGDHVAKAAVHDAVVGAFEVFEVIAPARKQAQTAERISRSLPGRR